MVAKCIHNRGIELGPVSCGGLHTEETVFDLTLDKNYSVFGLGLFQSTLALLVFSDQCTPSFLPTGLFHVDGQKLPSGWEFAVYDAPAASGVGEADYWVALWGFPELVRDPEYAGRLVDGDPTALDIFYLQLAQDSRDLLVGLIEKKLPQMLDWVPQIGSRRLDGEEREELHRAVVEEMDAEGFFRNEDPTDRARELNDLLVYLPYL